MSFALFLAVWFTFGVRLGMEFIEPTPNTKPVLFLAGIVILWIGPSLVPDGWPYLFAFVVFCIGHISGFYLPYYASEFRLRQRRHQLIG